MQRSNPLKTVRQKGANSDAVSSKIPRFCKDRVFWGSTGQYPGQILWGPVMGRTGRLDTP